MIMWIVASIVFAVVIAWLTLEPVLLEGAGAGDAVAATRVRGDATERALRSLKDLEFDFKMGKLSAEDYERVRSELAAEAAHLLDTEK